MNIGHAVDTYYDKLYEEYNSGITYCDICEKYFGELDIMQIDNQEICDECIENMRDDNAD